MACLLGSCSLMSPNDLRFSDGTAGGGRCMLNISSVARWHCRILRPPGSCISIQSGAISWYLTNSTRVPTSIWLTLIISARTNRFSASVNTDSILVMAMRYLESEG